MVAELYCGIPALVVIVNLGNPNNHFATLDGRNSGFMALYVFVCISEKQKE